MLLEFYFDSQKTDAKLLETILGKLSSLNESNCEKKFIDVNGISPDKKFEYYSKAWAPSVVKKYKIRKVFGTHRNPGSFFGEVPALLAYEDNAQHPADVFPHDKHGRLVTIEEFLNAVLSQLTFNDLV